VNTVFKWIVSDVVTRKSKWFKNFTDGVISHKPSSPNRPRLNPYVPAKHHLACLICAYTDQIL